MQWMVAVIFWGSLLGILFTYIGYPVLVGVLARMVRGAGRWGSKSRDHATIGKDGDLPVITVLIAAHNAEAHLNERIENVLACNFPPEKLQVIVASDGSTDATVENVHRMNDARVRVFDFCERRGKAATLVDAVKKVTNPVVVFTDATSRFDRDSLCRLTRHFKDSRVGVVAGKAIIVDEAGRPSESLYWRVETKVRQWEAQLGITLGASGAIYAVRREWFVAPTRPIINDDLVFPTLVSLSQQCSVVFDESAIAFASSPGGTKSEFVRRLRIGTGAMQCLPVLTDLLCPRNVRTLVAFACHKLLRWASPFLMVIVLACNVTLGAESLYRNLLIAQCLFYAMAGYGWVAGSDDAFSKIARSLTAFVVMNLALATGILRWLAHPNQVIWNPTVRPSWNEIADASDASASSKRAA